MNPDLLFFQASLDYVNNNNVEDEDTDYEVVLGVVCRWIANGTSVEFSEWSKQAASRSSALQNILDGWELLDPPCDLIANLVRLGCKIDKTGLGCNLNGLGDPARPPPQRT